MDEKLRIHCFFFFFLLFFLIFIGGTFILGYVAENPYGGYMEPNYWLAEQYFNASKGGAIILGSGILVYIIICVYNKTPKLRQKKTKSTKQPIEDKWGNYSGMKLIMEMDRRKREEEREREFKRKLWAKLCPNCNTEIEYPLRECKFCGWISESLKKAREELKQKEKKEKRNRVIPKHVQREVWRRDRGRCVECGSKERLEFDHIIPFSKGGSNTARNIQLLCEKCNKKKSNSI